MRRTILALLLAGLFTLSACTAPGGQAEMPAGSATRLTLPESTVTPALSAQANAGMTQFGVDLLRRTRTADSGQSVLISPLSAVLALSMTANGADGDTLAEFETVLGAGLSDLNANAAQLMEDYANLGGSTRASIANSLWADVDMTFYDQFLAGCAGYQPGLFTADLDTDGVREAVNWWINDQTQGMIPGMLTENLNSDIAALLINAVYLDNTWANKFSPEATCVKTFYPSGGESVFIDFMRQTEYLPYFSASGVSGALLPYDDGRLAFAVLLPDGDLDSFLAGLDGADLAALLTCAETVNVQLFLPKFTAAWSGDLTGTLRDMGLVTAFDGQQADFSNLGRRSEENIYLEFVMQATRLEVDEDGTKAAAATVVAPADSAAPIELAVLDLNRPFLYAIWDTEAEIPLFLGTFEGM